MKLSIIIIGDEILLGQVTDTNSGKISATFEPDGWKVERITVVGDSRAHIKSAIEEALSGSDLVITTGGLGPTKDDITRGVLMEVFGGTLVRDEAVAENIIDIFALRGLKLNGLTEDQALVPDSCRVVQNRFGTAPVMWFEREGKVLVAMPGVPHETEGMLPEVRDLVRKRFKPGNVFLHNTFIVTGFTESDLAGRLKDYEDSLPSGLHLAYLPQPGLVRLRLDGEGSEDIRKTFVNYSEKLRSLLGNNMFFGDFSVAEILLKKLMERGATLATAESCTGGNIARQITSVPGASEAYLGGVVSYANEVKYGLLNVSKDTLKRCGAVSREVVIQMAAGACRALGADCAVATSGIAGPGGATPDKPVGTVWIGWCVGGVSDAEVFRFPGDRRLVIERASTQAMVGLIHRLNKFQIADNE